MELLDQESHRLLLWLVRLDEVGHRVGAGELERLAEPRRAQGGELSERISGGRTGHAEGAMASLLRRGLAEPVEGDGDRVVPTDLGRRAVDAAALHHQVPGFEVIEADLRSGDPLVFARVVGRIAALDAPMVVDPYCRRAELEYLVAHTSVSRVLVSDRLAGAELRALASVVRGLRHREVPLRVRVAPAAQVQDRCVISRDRVVQVGDVAPVVAPVRSPAATVLAEPRDLAEAAREHYRRIWRRADRLAAYRPSTRRLRVA
jgi:hypothetical protein